MNLLPEPLRRMLPARFKQSAVPVAVNNGAGYFGRILESFAGAWQRNVEVDSKQDLLAFSAVYACVTMRAGDVAKLRIKLTRRRSDGTWEEVDNNTAHLPVLRKPNRYQTRIQFLNEWITSKLLYGNTYILKERDQRGAVKAMYVLDPRRVKPLVAPDGSVYYELRTDYLAGVEQTDGLTVPASEIIHDRCAALFHPLVGISPIYACGSSATQGRRIQANSSVFFENMSRPSMVITHPAKIPDTEMAKLKAQSEAGFSGANLGRFMVLGGGMKAEVMTIPASDAQLIEQLRWTVEDVARCFKIPLHKISSAAAPSYNNISAMNMDYYSQTLQEDIESIEILLDEGLELPAGMGTELDIDQLLRMDPVTRAESNAKRLASGELAPNEARLKENLQPVTGGEKPFMQQQMFPIDLLANRPAPGAGAPQGGGGGAPTVEPPTPQDSPTPPPAPPSEPSAKDLADMLIARCQEAVSAD